MTCGGCGRTVRKHIDKENIELYKVFGNYKYLNDRQLKARLDVYKKRNCSGCEKAEVCEIGMFISCKKVKL